MTLQKGKTVERVKRWKVAMGREREGWVVRTQKIFRTMETTLYDTVMVHTCQYIYLSIPIECPTLRWTVMQTLMCQCNFISYSNWTTLAPNVCKEGGCECVETGTWELSALSAQFCKTALKLKSYFKKPLYLIGLLWEFNDFILVELLKQLWAQSKHSIQFL